VQVVETGRKLFGAKRQNIFLEHLAASCNVAAAAAAAGVTVQCVYARRMRDAAFREAWGRALEQGYARLEAMLLEEAMRAEPIAVEGDLVLPDKPFDRDLALHLLREHGRRRGAGPGTGTTPPRPAEWSEVEAYWIKRLQALKQRMARGGRGGEGPGEEAA
jgi:hypothetical protein